MRGRVISLLLSSLFLATTATPQCDFRLEYSAALRSTYFDAAIDGNDLWTATGYGVQLFDRSVDPPRLIALAAVPATTRSIDVRSGVAYAGSGNSVHVMRRNGQRLEIVRSVDAAATVNDIVASQGALFVATTGGLASFDRSDPLNPSGRRVLPTSSANVLSLARNGESELFAADGDATVERFNIASGASTGAINALPRSSAVSVAGNRIFVSDGQQTRIFTISGTQAGEFSTGAVTVALHAENTFFVAGTDRRFRAIDLTLAAEPVELFAADIIPTGGSVNRIGALIAADDRLYVAGGDAGLVALDTSAFTSPFPLRAHPFGPKTSSADSASAVFVGNGGGGLTELTRQGSGNLAPGRNWGEAQTYLVHEFANDFLLTSSGAALTYWTTRSVNPVVVSSSSLGGAIRTAVVNGSTAIVLLDDGTLWSADLTREQPAPAKITVPSASLLARSDRGITLGNVTEQGVTELRFHANGNLGAAPVAAAIAGASSVLAMDESRAAVFTFRGITVVDFSGSSPSELVLPRSNTAIVRDLAMRGTTLLDLTSSSLRVWDLFEQRLVRTFSLPSEPLALSLHPTAPIATVLTADGVVTVSYEATTQQPEQVALIAGNRYATKAVATSKRLFVFDGRAIDIYETAHSSAPRHLTAVSVPGAIDLAASESALFVLFSGGAVTSYSHGGALLRSITIDEGSDAVPLAISAAGGAPWVSISRGCITTGCEEKTLVLDPSSLVQTSTIEGGVNDLALSGAVAHGLISIPPRREIRSYDVADPLHPQLLASTLAESSGAAIARHESEVLVLGTRLFRYSHPFLTKIGEELASMNVSAASDIAVDQGCLIVTGRSLSAEAYRWSGTQWTAAGAMALPGTARRIIEQPGRMVILTDYSLEVWSRLAATAPPRRRAAR